MSDLPNGWVKTELEDILSLMMSGKRPKGGVKGIQEGLLSLGGEHIGSDGIVDLTTPRYIPHEFAQSLGDIRIFPSDILIVKDGATTGKTAFADRRFEIHIAFINEHIFLCRVNQLINDKFVFYYLRSPNGTKEILSDFRGAAQGGIGRTFAEKVQLPVAPLNEQRRIVAKLDRLFANSRRTREELEHIPKLIKRYKQAVLAAACSGRLTENWRAQNPNVENASELLNQILDKRKKGYEIACKSAKANGTRNPKAPDKLDFEEFEFEFSEGFELPESWVFSNCRMLADFITDGEHATPTRTEEGILLLSARNIHNGFLKLDKVDYIPEYEYDRIIQRCYPQEDDILISCSGSVGRVCRVPSDLKFTMVRSVALIKLQYNLELSQYLELALQSEIIQNQILKLQKCTAQANLFIGQIGKIVVLLPPLEEQKEIIQRVEKLLRRLT